MFNNHVFVQSRNPPEEPAFPPAPAGMPVFDPQTRQWRISPQFAPPAWNYPQNYQLLQQQAALGRQFGFLPGSPFQPPAADQPQVNIEINIILNDENLSSMASKIPFIQILVDKGVIPAAPQPPPNPPAPVPENAQLGRRASISPAPAPIVSKEPAKPVPDGKPAAGREQGRKENLEEYTEIKCDIEKMIEDNLQNPIRLQQALAGPKSPTRGFVPLPKPLQRSGPRSAQNENEMNSSARPDPLPPVRPSPGVPAEVPQFSFQKIRGGAEGPLEPASGFRQFYSKQPHSGVDKIALEMEKIRQNHARRIKNFWDNQETYQPYLFKRRYLTRTAENPGGEIVEIIDYSNKKISDAELARSEGEVSNASSYSAQTPSNGP